MGRYDISGLQSTWQPGSNEQVLANKLGITSRAQMDQAELMLLRKLYLQVLRHDPVVGPISVDMIHQWHHRWLGNVYAWAGRQRSVNMSKDGFPFAAAAQIPQLMQAFQKNVLQPYTPCHGMSADQLIQAMAVVHVEFILIHPFREGNGRISRLMADVMAAQAGWGPLDYTPWESNKLQYVAAIQQGLSGDYEAMKAQVALLLETAA